MRKVDRLRVQHLDNLILSRMEIRMYVGERRLCEFSITDKCFRESVFG